MRPTEKHVVFLMFWRRSGSEDVVGISDYAKFWHGGGRECLDSRRIQSCVAKVYSRPGIWTPALQVSPPTLRQGLGNRRLATAPLRFLMAKAFWNDKHSEALNHKRSGLSSCA